MKCGVRLTGALLDQTSWSLVLITQSEGPGVLWSQVTDCLVWSHDPWQYAPPGTRSVRRAVGFPVTVCRWKTVPEAQCLPVSRGGWVVSQPGSGRWAESKGGSGGATVMASDPHEAEGGGPVHDQQGQLPWPEWVPRLDLGLESPGSGLRSPGESQVQTGAGGLLFHHASTCAVPWHGLGHAHVDC